MSSFKSRGAETRLFWKPVSIAHRLCACGSVIQPCQAAGGGSSQPLPSLAALTAELARMRDAERGGPCPVHRFRSSVQAQPTECHCDEQCHTTSQKQTVLAASLPSGTPLSTLYMKSHRRARCVRSDRLCLLPCARKERPRAGHRIMTTSWVSALCHVTETMAVQAEMHGSSLTQQMSPSRPHMSLATRPAVIKTAPVFSPRTGLGA